MNALADLAVQEATLKALLDLVKEQYDSVRAGMQAALDGDAGKGVRQVGAVLPDGALVAKVVLSDPKPAAVVTDEKKFLAWVRENRPDQVHAELVVKVREAFVKALLAEMTAAKTPQWCDEDGVLHQVPGVDIRATRARGHSVRFEDNGQTAVAAAWRAGQLADLVQLALPAAE